MKKDRIKERRKELKLTQTDVGKSVGVSKVTVSQWESGDTSPKGGNLLKLAKVLRVDADWIESGKGGGPHHTIDVDQIRDGVDANDNSSIALFDRDNLSKWLKKRPFKLHSSISSISIPESLNLLDIFAMVEDMDGLAPLINKQDYVFICPDMPLKTDTNSMFWVNDTPIIGIVTKSPMGMTLRFISQAPGWDPIPVDEKDYIGRVIAIDPVWAREQRDT